jgi:hypothetical protein
VGADAAVGVKIADGRRSECGRRIRTSAKITRRFHLSSHGFGASAAKAATGSGGLWLIRFGKDERASERHRGCGAAGGHDGILGAPACAV